jgi:hypothetical protein
MTEYQSPLEIDRSRGTVSPLRRPIYWLFAVVIVAVVLIEGFALSWGDARPVAAKVPHHHTLTTIAQPAIRLCPTTSAQLMEVDYLRNPGYGEKASVIGHVVTVHCGGFDDFQFIVHATPVTVHLRKGARIVLMNAEPSYYVGTLEKLNDYLSVDFDGNVFVVTGPDSSATGLIAQFHP